MNAKLDAVIQPVQAQRPEPVPPAGPQLPVQGNQQTDGFSATQLSQIKALLESMLPSNGGSGSSGDTASQIAVKKPMGEPGKLSVLQKALLSSMFDGKTSLAEGEGLNELQAKIKGAWSQRSIVDAMGSFLSEHCAGQIPKTKDDRIKLFSDTLLSLH